MNIVVLDTETTGFEPGDVVELAYVRKDWSYYTSLVKPTCPIEIQAMASHHITEEMVVPYPTLEQQLSAIDLRDAEYIVAHNAAFDRKFLPQLVVKRWICTWRCALHLWKDAPSHSNQALRYWLKLDVGDLPAEAGSTSHRALYDAWVTKKLFEREIDEVIATCMAHDGPDTTREQAVELMYKMTGEPVILNKVRFGKHEGKLWSEVERGYLSWILKQSNFDEDTMHTARFWLNNDRPALL
jgi:exodeoxyribonuclease X